MKKWFAAWLVCLLLLPGFACADPIDAFGLDVDKAVSVLDFDQAHLQVTDAQALSEMIDQLPCLTEVLLYESNLPREDMEWLFDRYPHIFFGFTLRIASHVIRTDDTAFSTLHTTLTQTKTDWEHSNEELSVLRMCTKLKALDIGHNQVTDLSFLSNLTDLRVLIIGPGYYIEDLSPLANLTKLEYLEAFSNKTRDVSMLAGMTELRDLNLACCRRLSDLSPLYNLPKLERFWGYRCKLDRDAQKEMERSHPSCEFDWENNPTAGTWREHPRYEVIYEMFHSNEYIPFDN